ncbi:replication fork protection component Swi3-domain-containing protein [Irpex rosettiformis]|uniref:Replication fork protection component Swi3-domain-containing protein n=1 Tax=Irpex rosettiformis TaxID=378272 RepID=A0ACB8UHD4_9APHY|nr:replication fork protection component Swi3-domain-containing protein [Irpex rosettiformis]
MSISIDDIWDTPLDSTPPRARKDVLASEANSNTLSRPFPAKRRRTTLFLSSDSENDAPSTSKNVRESQPPPQPTQKDKQRALIDALFDDLDGEDDDGGFKELAPAPSIDEMRRRAQATQRNRTRIPMSTPHQVMPSSSPERDMGPEETEEGGKGGGKGKKGEDGVKKKKPIAKLDETRLIGDSGFPALIKQTKEFKPRGKGHELSDLNRALGIYQFWTHKMYPKGTFHDNVQRIERLCHSKRMQNHLGMWRDAAKGLVNGRRPEDLEPLGDPADSDSDESDREQEQPTIPDISASANARSSSPPTRPPSSASERPSSAAPNGDDDFDIDEMIREDEERQRREEIARAGNSNSMSHNAPQPGPSRAPPQAEPDEDQEMWEQLDGGVDDEMTIQPPPQNQRRGDDVEDEEMWDLVREMEESTTTPSVPKATTAVSVPGNTDPEIATAQESTQAQKPPPPATNDEGWDEMYL